MSDFAQHLTRRDALGRLALATVGTQFSLPETTVPTVQAAAELDLDRLLRLANVPSVSLVTFDGREIHTRSAGVRRRGEPDAASADTVYAAASLTKTVASYVILSLVEDGALTLDRPLREVLPLPVPNDPRAAGITARRLLSHSGGWRNWRNTAAQALTIDFEPGSRWGYSGEGFFFLQRVAEKLTGKSFSQLAREIVFAPLGMRSSSLAGVAELEPRMASRHNSAGEPGTPFGRAALIALRTATANRPGGLESATVVDSEAAFREAESSLPPLPNFLSPNAAGSMLTTAADFGLFIRHLVTARQQGGRPAAIVGQMLTPQIRGNEAIEWGLGVGLETIDGRRCGWQHGDNPGFKNFVTLDPTRGSGAAVFTNGDRGIRVYERVIRDITGVDHPAFLWS